MGTFQKGSLRWGSRGAKIWTPTVSPYYDPNSTQKNNKINFSTKILRELIFWHLNPHYTELLRCLSDLENPSQLPVRKVLMILSYKMLKFSDYSCFRGRGIHCWYFYRATLFELPRKSRSTSGSRVPQRYWYLYLMDFHNFFTIYVFEVKESIVDILTELWCLSDSIIQVNFRFERYWWFCLMNFWNFHTIRILEVRESIADISTELPCLGNLEIPGKLPVQDLLGGTGECVL